MRTNGASSETSMVLIVIVIAGALLVMLAGGPSDVMHFINNSVKVTLEYCAGLYHRLA